MKRYVFPILAFLFVSPAEPAMAQENGVLRRSFAFFDRNLTVEVVGEGSGVLHVVRGGRDRVEVTARTELGTPAFAMAGSKQDRLRLSGAGLSQEYVVVVPEDVRVELILPPGDGAVPAASGPAASYRWPVAPKAGEAYVPQDGTGSMLAYEYAATPGVVALDGLNAFERVSVRVGEPVFRLSGSRPLDISARGADGLAVRASEPTSRLVVELPGSIRDFVLVADGIPIVAVGGDGVRVYCSPSTRQVLSGGRQWVEITASARRLECDGSR